MLVEDRFKLAPVKGIRIDEPYGLTALDIEIMDRMRPLQ